MTALGVAGAREMGSIVRFGQISARSSKDRKWPNVPTAEPRPNVCSRVGGVVYRREAMTVPDPKETFTFGINGPEAVVQPHVWASVMPRPRARQSDSSHNLARNLRSVTSSEKQSGK